MTSPFSNPAATAQGNSAQYIDDLLARIGDRDPWEELQTLVARLREMIAGLDDDALHRPEAPGKWSIAGVIQHLVEGELVYGYRMRTSVADNTPTIQGYDQDAWSREFNYNAAPVETVLAELEILRNMNLRMLRALTDEQWERVGLHSERGPESVRRIFTMLAGHDLVHVAQIERIMRRMNG